MADEDHFYGIDGLRGLAALGVLVSHYQHFYFPEAGILPSDVDRVAQPFYGPLLWVFENGAYGVQLFWTISGVVFAHRYVAGAETSGTAFLIRRFARLYPLYFVTLLLVAVLQAISKAAFGHSQIYLFNDQYHFVLNLFMASGWGLERGFSFNAPVWSISVEILVYAAFLISLPLLRRAWWAAIPIVLITAYINRRVPQFSAVRCALFFYSGVAVYELQKRLPAGWTLGAAIAAAALAFLPSRYGFLDWASLYRINLMSMSAVAIAALVDRGRHPRVRMLRPIGDISYPVYLLHIPVQVAILLLFEADVAPRSIANSPVFFMGFFAFMIAISLLVHRRFEGPARQWLVRRLLSQASLGESAEPKTALLA